VWHIFHFVVRPAEALLGLSCLSTALLLYPDEEGTIQSKLEDFWIRFHDYQRLALSRAAAFMQQVAQFESHFLDRIFGERWVSFRLVSLSCCGSLLSLSSWYIIRAFQANQPRGGIRWVGLVIGSIGLALTIVFVKGPLTRIVIFISDVLFVAFWWTHVRYIVKKFLDENEDDRKGMAAVSAIQASFEAACFREAPTKQK
jgi:hypothetical protein